MKQIFSADDVAHKWANKHQDRARNSGGNFYFTLNTIYSYGDHFPIAKHVQNKKGENAVLFTNRKYSNTTAKHLCWTRQACSHLNVIYCERVPAGNDPIDHNKNFGAWVYDIHQIAANLPRAKKPEIYISGINGLLDQVKKYCEFFGIKPKAEYNKVFTMPVQGFKEMAEKAVKKAAKLKAEREKNEKKRIEQELEEFRAFESKHVNTSDNTAYLRYNTKTKRIETSKGVEIPREIGRRFYMWMIDVVTTGGCNGNCEQTILTYKVKAVSKTELQVGCHTISMVEIGRIGALLKWNSTKK